MFPTYEKKWCWITFPIIFKTWYFNPIYDVSHYSWREVWNCYFLCLCKPQDSQLNIEFTTCCDLPWLHSHNDYPSITYQLLSSVKIKNIFMQLHPSYQPLLGKKNSENSIILVSTFHERSQKQGHWSWFTPVNSQGVSGALIQDFLLPVLTHMYAIYVLRPVTLAHYLLTKPEQGYTPLAVQFANPRFRDPDLTRG